MTDWINVKKIREAVYVSHDYNDWDKSHTTDERIMQTAYQDKIISYHIYNAYLHSKGSSLTVDEIK